MQTEESWQGLLVRLLSGPMRKSLQKAVDGEARAPQGRGRAPGPQQQLSMVELESSSPEETEGIGAAVARELGLGDVVAVSGELGTGKTTLVGGPRAPSGSTGR